VSGFWKRTLLGIVVAIPVLLVIFFRTDGTETIDALKDANYALIPPAVVLLILTIYLYALRWRYLLKPLADIPAINLYPVVFIGHLGNSLLPLRGGDLLMAFILRRREGVSGAAALGSIVVEHILDGMMLVVLLFIFIASANTGERIWQLALVSGLVFGGAGAVLVAAAVWQEQTERLAEMGLSHLPERWRGKLHRLISSFLEGTRALRSVEVVVVVFATTVAYWLLIAVVYMIVGQAFDIDAGFDAYLLVTAAANLAFSVPLTQGGLGSFEFLVQQALIFADVDEAVAAAYALVLHGLILVSMVTAGLISLWIVGFSVREISEEVEGRGEQEETSLSADLVRHDEHLPAEEELDRL
jgi:glycosyltransferase 2 family protein